MCLAEMIKETRTEYGISQSELANRLNISQSIISDIENRKRSVPADLISKLPKALNDSAKVKAEICYETGADFFNVPILKNVDDNPKNVLEVLITEISEALQSIQEIKKLIINVKPGKHLADDTKDEVIKHEEQIADLYAALKMHFTTMDEAYGIKLKDIEKRVNKKLKLKGYI